ALQEREMIRIRALSGLAEIEGQNALPALTAAMAAQSPRVQAVCIRLLTAIPGPEVTASMRNVFPNLPPTGQVRLLTALATRGDASARPLLLEALKSKFADVRAAALSALAVRGNSHSRPEKASSGAISGVPRCPTLRHERVVAPLSAMR